MRKAGTGGWGLGLFIFMILLGCATPPTALLPVAVPCPQPPQLVRPHLAIQDLQPQSPPTDVLKAYVVTVEQLRGYAEELEIIINGYRVSPIPSPQPPVPDVRR